MKEKKQSKPLVKVSKLLCLFHKPTGVYFSLTIDEKQLPLFPEQEEKEEKEFSLPPLFDDITDKELSLMSEEIGELIQQINNLRDKQLNGGGLSDDEVREGIRLLNEIRALRAGKSSTPAIREPLEKFF